MFLKRKGFEVIYLGTSIAEDDIDVVLEQVKPKFLFLACTLEKNVSKTLALVDYLRVNYEQLEIGLGGSGFNKVSNETIEAHQKYLLGETKSEWEHWLKNKLANVI